MPVLSLAEGVPSHQTCKQTQTHKIPVILQVDLMTDFLISTAGIQLIAKLGIGSGNEATIKNNSNYTRVFFQL